MSSAPGAFRVKCLAHGDRYKCFFLSAPGFKEVTFRLLAQSSNRERHRLREREREIKREIDKKREIKRERERERDKERDKRDERDREIER